MSRRKSSKRKKQNNLLANRNGQLGIGAVALIVIVAVVWLAFFGSDDNASYVTLDAQAAFDRYSANGNAVIVDVREPGEWATTGIPADAVPYSLTDLRQYGPPEDAIAKNQEVFVICNSGNRSQEASQIFSDNGYQDVINIAGGIIAWGNTGLPIEVYAQ